MRLRLKDCTTCGARPHPRGKVDGFLCCDSCEHPLQNRQVWLGRFGLEVVRQ